MKLGQSAKLGVVFIGFVLIAGYDAFAARRRSDRKEIHHVETNIKGLKDDISDLKVSVHSLDELRDRLSSELLSYESNFKESMRKVIVPLLSWPDRFLTLNASSWVELEHANFVLKEVQKKLVHRPLKLISDRELRLERIGKLRQEMSTNLSQLESKKNLLSLQLEELKMLRHHSRRGIRHATGKTKAHIGDIEGEYQ